MGIVAACRVVLCCEECPVTDVREREREHEQHAWYNNENTLSFVWNFENIEQYGNKHRISIWNSKNNYLET